MSELESQARLIWSAAAKRSVDAAVQTSPRRSITQPRLALLLLFFFVLTPTFAGTLAQFRTPFGEIDVELYDTQKPVTVRNFKRLVQSGAYQNTFFHRLEPGFVIQGGGFATFAGTSAGSYFAPPWSYLSSVTNFGSIPNEFSVGPKLSNVKGTIAMAKTSDPNSATSQFFFNLADNSSSLDNPNNSGGFTVFGHVVGDTNNILGFFNTLSNYYGIIPMGSVFPSDGWATSVFYTLPVTYAGPYYPHYADLVYVDISLLSVQVTQSNNRPLISWNSARGMTNVVEYTTVMPPVWHPLTNILGSGNRLSVTDSTATNLRRFYRVRVY